MTVDGEGRSGFVLSEGGQRFVGTETDSGSIFLAGERSFVTTPVTIFKAAN
ncbi:MAG: hypothetical protein ACKVOG_03395 [Rhodoglobus sp.]